MMKCILGLLLFAFLYEPAIAKSHEGLCVHKLLATGDESLDTRAFTMYFELLIQNQVLTTEELSLFAKALDKNKLINPVRYPHMNKRYQMAHDEFQELLNFGSVDIPKVQTWANRVLAQSQLVVKQKENSKQRTETLPEWVTDQGAQFYKFIHPSLGEAYRILKPRGHYENESDWDELVWAVNSLKNDQGDLLWVDNILGNGDPLDRSRVSKDSAARKACLNLLRSADLPTFENYDELFKYFDHKWVRGKVMLTPRGIEEFIKLFPDARSRTYWTSSVSSVTARSAWLFDSDKGYTEGDYQDHITYRVRCVASRRESKTE